jgi:small subunit ribosomal protein S17
MNEEENQAQQAEGADKQAEEQAPAEAASEEASVEGEGAEGEEVAEGEAAEGQDAAREEGAPEEASAEPAPAEAPAGAAEPEEALSPKQRRKRERSQASGPPGPQLSPEQRAGERAERRRAAAERRRRYRAARRRKRGEPGAGTPPAPREPGPKKVRQGTVVSTGGDKTITVEIAVVRRHPTYEKVVRRTSRLRAHDESNRAQEGDIVRVVESRPLSRTKRWRLLEILERAR